MIRHIDNTQIGHNNFFHFIKSLLTLCLTESSFQNRLQFLLENQLKSFCPKLSYKKSRIKGGSFEYKTLFNFNLFTIKIQQP